MQTCILDGATIRDKETLHTLLAKGLNFPCWYGRNLDALYDCLSDVGEETEVVVRNPELLEHTFGKRARLLMHVLERAAELNPNIHVRVM